MASGVTQHKRRLANDVQETRGSHKQQVLRNTAERENKSSQKQNASSSADKPREGARQDEVEKRESEQ